MKKFTSLLAALTLSSIPIMAQQDVGFIEEFALAENREEALKQLIPGTGDYYYYHALHFQNERSLAELDRILDEWRKQFKNSSQRKQIENREALIRYSDDPQATLDYLKKELNLQFNHQQEGQAREEKHPSKLDQKIISWDAYLDLALRSSSNLQNINESAFYFYLTTKPRLSTEEHRDLLSRATLPDLPGLTDLILTDLKTRESKGFGEFSIHRSLTKAQLEKLLATKKDLINNEAFVQTYLAKLLPGADENLANSPEVREAYLDRSWKFAATLAPSFTSLKAHLLYQRLVHDRAMGEMNQKRFLTYLALPRNVSYLNPEWRKSEEVAWRHAADLGRDYRSITTLPPVAGSDQDLVKSYLLHFLKDAPDFKKFSPYLRESWLRRIFAEAKITHGIGKPGDWASLLSPSEFQSLKDRVDIEFDPTSREIYELNDEVTLPVHVKNVSKLIVKVFEINTLNYYRNLGNEVSTDIDLDGLVANEVEVYEYPDAPQLRVRREFKIPAIEKRRGLWVVEFIGGGKSSRAVIRKGALGIITQTLPQGELVTVLDEKHQPLKKAAVWAGTRKYECDDKGRTLLPFSNNPGKRSLVIQDTSGFATIAALMQPAENYQLAANMHVAQESLRTGGKAQIIIRPTLNVAGETISLDRIEKASLVLSSNNLDGIPATTTVENIKLSSDREFVHEFRVPDRLTQLTATLKVTLKVASKGGEEIDLTSSETFEVNESLASNQVADLYLSRIDGSHRIEFLGRNGEPLAGQNLNVTLTHRHFKLERFTTLKTTKTGAIDLGPLENVTEVSVATPAGNRRFWTLNHDRRDHVNVINLTANQELKVPFIGKLDRKSVALFSQGRGGILTDEFKRLKLQEGYLTAKLPRGDFRLHLKSPGKKITIAVAAGTVTQGHVFNDTRMLELPVRQPSHIEKIKTAGETMEIDLSGADALTRIHVIATRFLPGNDPFHHLGGSQRSGLTTGQARYLPSLYISGRNLGDELRYILERRYADKFPGNMLTRPEILLNPWAVRDTEAGEEMLADGDKFDRKATPAPAPATIQARRSKSRAEQIASIQTTSYEFLADAPVVVANLKPDQNGKLSIKLDAFGDRQHVHVLLVDPDGSTYRSVSLPDRKTAIRDLRLLGNALDPKRHYTEQEQVTLLKKGDKLKLPDLLNSEFELFDNIDSVYQYFRTLNNDDNLNAFAFITNWPSLTDEEKRANYSEFASHELSFFLSRKDPDFFKKVILPHLANKKDRTFMDDYLLGNPLAKFREPFEYARLNVVERILLTGGDSKQLSTLALDLEHRLALQTPDVDQTRFYFRSALGRGAFGGTYAGAKFETATLANFESRAGSTRSLGVDEFADDGEPQKALKRRAVRVQESKSEALMELRKNVADFDSDGFGAFTTLPGTEDFGIPQLYRALDPTKEWAENNYYHLPIDQHVYELINENRFWLDLAKHGMKGGFGSRYLGEATGNFAEMMLALAFLDLPFEAPEHSDKIENGAFDFTAGGNTLFFHREVREAGLAEKRPPLLVSQSYFQLNDRFRTEDGQKVDKFITEEFVKGIVYGSQIVVTNPTSSRQALDILSQLPKGAIAVNGQRATATQPVELQPYSTHRLELAFYFPSSGEFPVYPAHLSKGGEVVAHAETMSFKVVDEPTKIDKTSWAWISQWGEVSTVLEYLEKENLHLIDLNKVAWRFRESEDFYKAALGILDTRGISHPALRSYAVVHNDRENLEQYLLMQRGFLNGCGLALKSELITLDPINLRSLEHLEYKPLINNRAHALGGENRILNPVIREQYRKFLNVLSQRKSLDDIDRLSVTYHLFLQDRVGEALAHLKQVDAGKLETKMQYDYFQAYAAMYQADLKKARQLAAKYQKYPVDRWQERFAEITAQIAEIEGAGPEVIDEGNREQEQAAAAAKEPSLDLKVEGVTATLGYENVAEVTVNYYEMDLEFLFSTNPFVSSDTSRFAIIQPNQSSKMKLAKGKVIKNFDLPKKYQSSNVIVEVIGGGKKASKAVYANNLRTILSETMGLLTVRHGKTGKPLPKTYVKVYGRTNEGVKFFKDGYTDLRGKFDYASVSTTGLGAVTRFSLLIMSEDHGATVEEATVPQR